MSLKQFSKEELREMSFIEVAHDLLAEKKSVVTFQELLDEITSLLDVSESEARGRMVQFYTDLNIDGRFIALGENRWGLREWYPIEQIEEETVPTIKAKKKKTKKASKADEELELDEYEDLDEEELDYDDLDDIEEEDLSDDDDDDLDDDDFDDDEEDDIELDEEDDLDDDDLDDEDEEEDDK